MSTLTETATTLRIRVTPEFKESIEAFAAKNQISVSAITRQALVQAIKREDSEAATPQTKEAV